MSVKKKAKFKGSVLEYNFFQFRTGRFDEVFKDCKAGRFKVHLISYVLMPVEAFKDKVQRSKMLHSVKTDGLGFPIPKKTKKLKKKGKK